MHQCWLIGATWGWNHYLIFIVMNGHLNEYWKFWMNLYNYILDALLEHLEKNYYKEFYPYQPMCLWLVFKSTIITTNISTILPWHVIKTTCSHILNYKMVLSCKCDYDLQLLLVWTKKKMKIVVTSFTIGDVQQ
jgi:hypothetical protein